MVGEHTGGFAVVGVAVVDETLRPEDGQAVVVLGMTDDGRARLVLRRPGGRAEEVDADPLMVDAYRRILATHVA